MFSGLLDAMDAETRLTLVLIPIGLALHGWRRLTGRLDTGPTDEDGDD